LPSLSRKVESCIYYVHYCLRHDPQQMQGPCCFAARTVVFTLRVHDRGRRQGLVCTVVAVESMSSIKKDSEYGKDDNSSDCASYRTSRSQGTRCRSRASWGWSTRVVGACRSRNSGGGKGREWTQNDKVVNPLSCRDIVYHRHA